MAQREESLLHQIDPFYQAHKAIESVEGYGEIPSVVSIQLGTYSATFRKGVADAVSRMHKTYAKKKMPLHPFQVMQEVYGEGGWFI